MLQANFKFFAIWRIRRETKNCQCDSMYNQNIERIAYINLQIDVIHAGRVLLRVFLGWILYG